LIVLPRLYAIVDVDVAARARWEPSDLARAYLTGGARLLQLRAKTLASGAFLDLAAAMAEDARAAGADLIVNDRADVAVLAKAAGVHVGQDDLSPEDVRKVVSAEAVVGFSTHSEAQIDDALARPISYFAVGPVFGTSTKDTGYERVGLPLVQEAARRAAPRGLPVVGIGGVTLETSRSVIEAGAAAVAVITDLLQGNPEDRVRRYLQALG
jgi:thiamine-phosphate pyrophosphorylase